jgi:eukaryotic-like serine/threonine-protein kinase
MHPQFLRMIMSECAVQVPDSVGGATDKGAETPASGLIGTTLEGAYRITRLIAEGGMSAVYEAVQLRLNQRLAVKVMARELSSNQEALRRFQREADITSRLRHPHLVTVMDFGTAPAGQPYLVMEYLEGIDLDHRIRQLGKLPLAAAVHITRQVASALGAAHDQGVVHRDLKPANVFLVELPGEPDFAKVLDFGISKVRAANTQLTKASSIIGTPNYMAPEQATGMLDEIDARTDQWSLACIVWEMLSGRPPFAADDVSAVFYQVIHLEPQPLRKQAPDVPAAVESVLRRGLSKNTADRFPSVRDFAEALAVAAEGRPAERASRSTDRTAASAGAATAVTVAAAGRVDRRRRHIERRREALDTPSFWTKVKPIHALSCLTLAVVVAVLVTLRWSHSATAAAPAATPAATPARAIVVTTVVPPTLAVPPPPAPVPVEPAVPEPRRAAPVRVAKPKPAVREAPDPFESAGRQPHHARGHADRVTRKPNKTGNVDFVDPFAP